MSPEPEKRIYIDKYKQYRKNLVPRGDFQSLPEQIPENPDKPETLHSLVAIQGEKLKYRSTILIQRPREISVPTAIVPPAPQELVEPSEEPGPSATSDSNTEEIFISGSPPPVRRSRSQHIALTGPSGILGERDLITNSTFRVPGKYSNARVTDEIEKVETLNCQCPRGFRVCPCTHATYEISLKLRAKLTTDLYSTTLQRRQ